MSEMWIHGNDWTSENIHDDSGVRVVWYSDYQALKAERDRLQEELESIDETLPKQYDWELMTPEAQEVETMLYGLDFVDDPVERSNTQGKIKHFIRRHGKDAEESIPIPKIGIDGDDKLEVLYINDVPIISNTPSKDFAVHPRLQVVLSKIEAALGIAPEEELGTGTWEEHMRSFMINHAFKPLKPIEPGERRFVGYAGAELAVQFIRGLSPNIRVSFEKHHIGDGDYINAMFYELIEEKEDATEQG